MGFGLLLIGYFVTYFMSMNPIGVVFRILGYLLIARAAGKLSEYDEKFKVAQYLSLLLGALNLADGAIKLTGFLYDNMVISVYPVQATAVGDILSGYAMPLAVLVFHILMLRAIRSIAKQTEISKIITSVGRNLFFIILYYVLSFIAYLPLPIQETYSRNMGLSLTLLYLAWILLEHHLVFSCYVHICDEGDVDMSPKRSRFAIINMLRDGFAARQERSRKADEQYIREKRERLKSKKK